MEVLTEGLEAGLLNCVTFDGGGTTGWSLMSVSWHYFVSKGESLLDNVVFWAAGQYTGPLQSQVEEAASLCSAWAPQYPGYPTSAWAPLDSLAVVVEDFTLRQFRMDPTLLEPVRFNAALNQELYHLQPKRVAFKQQPSLAMTTTTDERLALADAYADAAPRSAGVKGGYYAATRGKPHARDALRHNFTFFQREKAARWHGKSLIPVMGPSAERAAPPSGA